MADGVQVKVTKRGRIRAPNLDNGALTSIGRAMVKAQLLRWAAGVNADGQPAKPLSKRYGFQKSAFRGLEKGAAIRDNKMTGALVDNFTLRKAIQGKIRAEPTQRSAREHATKAQRYDQMIGFAQSDIEVVYSKTIDQYVRWTGTAFEVITP